jgi:DNA repair exonuclease SbcCD ATPase subunit
MRNEKAKQDLKTDFEAVMKSVRGLRDEIRLQLHLASLDLKDEWKKLEPRLAEAEQITEAISEASLELAHDVERRARALMVRLKALAQMHQR